VKQEPEDYPWSQLVAEGKTAWTGVRNFQARNYLKQMQVGDRVLYYHSGSEKRVVGVARVASNPRRDPTATEGDWWCVDLVPVKALTSPVELAAIREQPLLRGMALVKQSRLSVMPVTEVEFTRILELGHTSL
jgi:predicted RNA-binding protein with PUA-like domain